MLICSVVVGLVGRRCLIARRKKRFARGIMEYLVPFFQGLCGESRM